VVLTQRIEHPAHEDRGRVAAGRGIDPGHHDAGQKGARSRLAGRGGAEARRGFRDLAQEQALARADRAEDRDREGRLDPAMDHDLGHQTRRGGSAEVIPASRIGRKDRKRVRADRRAVPRDRIQR